jgi:hypothetical protein
MAEPSFFASFAWIAAHPWLYPLLEALHIVGIALLFGSLVLFELRVWGLGAGLPAQALARLALPLTLAGFCVAAATGLAMFASQGDDLIGNRIFLAKMALLLLAGLNALAFHVRDGLLLLDRLARLQTLVSLGLWVAVIMCGRWIAYA